VCGRPERFFSAQAEAILGAVFPADLRELNRATDGLYDVQDQGNAEEALWLTR
jgi:hypothetical protein